MKLKVLTSAMAASVVFASADVAVAQEYIYSTYSGPKHPFVVGAMVEAVSDMAEASDGAQNWRIAPGGQVLSARGTLEGLKGGLADAGFVIPVYTRSALPSSSLMFDYIGPGTDVLAGTGAALETIFKNCPSCLEEYAAQGTKLMAATSATHNVLMCGFDGNSVDDIRGRKVRAVGSMASLVKGMGGTPVNLPPPEGATAIQRGTVDCVMGPLAWLESYGLKDVTKTIIRAPFGFSKSLGIFVMNEGAFGRMTPEQQAQLQSRMPMLTSRYLFDSYIDEDKRLLEKAADLGITVVDGGEDFDAVVAAYVAEEKAEVVQRADAVGLTAEQADHIMSSYERLYPVWEERVRNVGNDPAAYAKLLTEFVYN